MAVPAISVSERRPRINDRPGQLDLNDASAVVRAFEEGAAACLDATCRQGSIDLVTAPSKLIATGDLHDNPAHLKLVAQAAGVIADDDGAMSEPAHLTLHELIHSDRLIAGCDMSYRALARAAEYKRSAPERVHVLLANHELAQIVGAGVVKNNVRCVDAFRDGLEYVFGDQAERVDEAGNTFIRALPVALRCSAERGDMLSSHSLPSPAHMARFDMSLLERDLTDADYQPRTGSAHMMVWGRSYDADQLEDLVERWGVCLFVLGHEHAENGVRVVPPCAVVLNSDHDRGVYLPIDTGSPITASEAPFHVVSLSQRV